MSNLASNITKAMNKKNSLAAPAAIAPTAPFTSKNISSPQNSSLISLFNKGPTTTLNSLSKNLSGNTTLGSKNSIFGAATAGVANAAKAANSAISSATTGVANAANSAITTATTGVANAAQAVTSGVSNAATAAATTTSNVLNSVSKNASNFMNTPSNYLNGNMNMVNNSATTNWGLIGGIFFLCFLIFISIFLFFNNELQTGLHALVERTRSAFGLIKPTPVPPKEPVAERPVQETTLLQKILPSEVFNVSKNEYSYYDAEALCSALGAELATIDQVKAAYEKGADWCNYGWVKGQGAVYPTQKSTWDLLQLGPEEERGACGTPGVNGGHFDNPEMKFGVNCYGPKPSQSGHDESELMKNGSIPKTVAGLQIYEKINEFKKHTNEMDILPFNEGKWSSS